MYQAFSSNVSSTGGFGSYQPLNSKYQNGNYSNPSNRDNLYQSHLKNLQFSSESPHSINKFSSGLSNNSYLSGYSGATSSHSNPHPRETSCQPTQNQQYITKRCFFIPTFTQSLVLFFIVCFCVCVVYRYEMHKQFEYVSSTPRKQLACTHLQLSREMISTPQKMNTLGQQNFSSQNRLSENKDKFSLTTSGSRTNAQNHDAHHQYDTKSLGREMIPRFSKTYSTNSVNSENTAPSGIQQFNDFEQSSSGSMTGSSAGLAQIYSTRSNHCQMQLQQQQQQQQQQQLSSSSNNHGIPSVVQQQIELFRHKQQQQHQQQQQSTLQQNFQPQVQQSTPSRRVGQPPIAPSSSAKHTQSSRLNSNAATPTAGVGYSSNFGFHGFASGIQSGQKPNIPNNQPPQYKASPSQQNSSASREPLRNMSNFSNSNNPSLTDLNRQLIYPQSSPTSFASQKFNELNQRNRFLAQQPDFLKPSERSLTPEQRIFLEKVNSLSHSLNSTNPSQSQSKLQNPTPASAGGNFEQVFQVTSPNQAGTIATTNNNGYQRDNSATMNRSSSATHYSGDFGQTQQLSQFPQLTQLTNNEARQQFEEGGSYYMPPFGSSNYQVAFTKQASGTKEVSQMIYADASLFNYQNDKDQSLFSNNMNQGNLQTTAERDYQTHLYASKEVSNFNTPHKPVNRQLSFMQESSAGLSSQKPLDTLAQLNNNNVFSATQFTAQSQQNTMKSSARLHQHQYSHVNQNQNQPPDVYLYPRDEIKKPHRDSPRFQNENQPLENIQLGVDRSNLNSNYLAGQSQAKKGTGNLLPYSSQLQQQLKNSSQIYLSQETPKQECHTFTKQDQQQQQQSIPFASEKIYQIIEEMKSNKSLKIPSSADENRLNNFTLNSQNIRNSERNNYSPVLSQKQIQRNNNNNNTAVPSLSPQPQLPQLLSQASPSLKSEQQYFNYLTKGTSTPFAASDKCCLSGKDEKKIGQIDVDMKNIMLKYETSTKNTYEPTLSSKKLTISSGTEMINNAENNYPTSDSQKNLNQAPGTPIPPPRLSTSTKAARSITPTAENTLTKSGSLKTTEVPQPIAAATGQYIPSLQAAATLHQEMQKEREKTQDRQLSSNNRTISQKALQTIAANPAVVNENVSPVNQNAQGNNGTNIAAQTVTAAATTTAAPAAASSSSSSQKQPLPIIMTKELEKFNFGKVLGFGSYAVVRVVETRQGEKFALKTYEKKKLQDPQKRKNVAREVKILSKIKHDNIVRLFDVIETECQLHLVMEMPSATALNTYIKSKPTNKLTEDEARPIFTQLVQAVKYCHRKSVVHRDIKMENVLYDAPTERIKLIDFGFSIALAPQSKLNIFCGTPSYMAPEIVNKTEYTFPVDIWALGILLFKAINGNFPFRGHDDKELFKRINLCKLDFQPHVSPQARHMLSRILQANPNERYTAEEILADEWMHLKTSETSQTQTPQTGDAN